MKAFVVGFPKAGTSTLSKAFIRIGVPAFHWRHLDGYVGQYIYKSYYAGENPLAWLDSYPSYVITQADVCIPRYNLNMWPQLDYRLLNVVREKNPEIIFILNYRSAERIVSSINRWFTLKDRLMRSDVPGLPKGYGTDADLLIWIEGHYAMIDAMFSGYENFIKIDIESSDAPKILSDRLGVTFRWWGVANKNQK